MVDTEAALDEVQTVRRVAGPRLLAFVLVIAATAWLGLMPWAAVVLAATLAASAMLLFVISERRTRQAFSGRPGELQMDWSSKR